MLFWECKALVHALHICTMLCTGCVHDEAASPGAELHDAPCTEAGLLSCYLSASGHSRTSSQLAITAAWACAGLAQLHRGLPCSACPSETRPQLCLRDLSSMFGTAQAAAGANGQPDIRPENSWSEHGYSHLVALAEAVLEAHSEGLCAGSVAPTRVCHEDEHPLLLFWRQSLPCTCPASAQQKLAMLP